MKIWKAIILTLIVVSFAFGVGFLVNKTEETEPIPVKSEMTVDDVVSKAGCDYFIVKEIDTWAVLEEDVYMDRPVTEINICDDTEDTLCIFIDLEDNEKPRIKQW